LFKHYRNNETEKKFAGRSASIWIQNLIKNVRKSNYPQLEEALLKCIREYKAKCPQLNLTGDILKAKATFFQKSLRFLILKQVMDLLQDSKIEIH